MNTSDTLNRAADLIDDRGWTKGTEGWNTPGSGLCIEGALMAALGRPATYRSMVAFWSCPSYQVVADYLELPVGADAVSDPAYREVWLWNDTKGRTAAEVVETLRACAVIEAARENADVEAMA